MKLLQVLCFMLICLRSTSIYTFPMQIFSMFSCSCNNTVDYYYYRMSNVTSRLQKKKKKNPEWFRQISTIFLSVGRIAYFWTQDDNILASHWLGERRGAYEPFMHIHLVLIKITCIHRECEFSYMKSSKWSEIPFILTDLLFIIVRKKIGRLRQNMCPDVSTCRRMFRY